MPPPCVFTRVRVHVCARLRVVHACAGTHVRAHLAGGPCTHIHAPACMYVGVFALARLGRVCVSVRSRVGARAHAVVQYHGTGH